MFEDPANETPYESREGGYQYVWGGPYEARDDFDQEFGGIVSEEVIDAAVSEVERTGIVYWAPGPNHPNQKARMEEAMANDNEPPAHDTRRYSRQARRRSYSSIRRLAGSRVPRVLAE